MGKYDGPPDLVDVVAQLVRGQQRLASGSGLADVGDPGTDAQDPDGTAGAGPSLPAPTGLSLSTAVFLDSHQGHAVANVTAVWNPVTNNSPKEVDVEDADADRSPVSDYLTSYRVGTGVWSRWGGTGGTTTVKFTVLPVDEVIYVRVRARTAAGQVGAIATANITAAADTTPPPKPSKPSIIGTLRGVSVKWNGLFDAGADRPPDFAYVIAEVSLTADFATIIKGGTLDEAGQTAVAPVGTAPFTVWARLVAVDHSGNRSVASDVETGGSIRIIPEDIGGGAVTTAALADAAVDASKLLNGAVVDTKLADLAVTVGKIADNAVIARTILAGQVITEKLAANAVTAAKIDALAVTAEKINAGAVTTGKVEANTITSSEIAAGAVTADELYSTAVTGKVITGGTFRTGVSGEDRIEIIDEVVYDAYLGYSRSIQDTIRWIRGGDGALVGEIRGYMGDIGAYGLHLNSDLELGNLYSTIYQVGKRAAGSPSSHVRVRWGAFSHTISGGSITHAYGSAMDNDPGPPFITFTSAHRGHCTGHSNSGFDLTITNAAGATPGDGTVISGYFYVEDFA